MRASSADVGWVRIAGLTAWVVVMSGCNAILGTEAGTSPDSTDGAVADGGTAAEGGSSGPNGGPDARAEGSVNASDGGSKPPCTTCSPKLVAYTLRAPTKVRVSGDYVYYATDAGVFRVNQVNIPCTSDACIESVLPSGDTTGGTFALADQKICYITDHFGCADLPNLGNRKDAKTSFGFNTTGMELSGGVVYSATDINQGDTTGPLAEGVADDLAAGTGAIADVSAANSFVDTFAIDATRIVWFESDLKPHLFTRALSGGATVEIPLPAAVANANAKACMVIYQDRVFFTTYDWTQIYSAPTDGSAAAAAILDVVPGTWALHADPTGLYVGSGNPAADVFTSYLGYAAWGAKSVTPLVSVDQRDQVVSVDVAADGIYYGVDGALTKSGIWRVGFD